MGRTDTQSVTKAAVHIKSICSLEFLLCFVGRVSSFVLVLMVTHMLRLSRSTLMHAIACYRSPAELER